MFQRVKTIELIDFRVPINEVRRSKVIGKFPVKYQELLLEKIGENWSQKTQKTK